MELGMYTFAERTPDPMTGRTIGFGERLRNLMQEIRLADRVGLDVFGVGEHHRPDFAVSSPAVVLAGAATTTERIRLTSAVSVLSSDDPVRVFQDFATLDLLSGGRAEIMVGRGSFIESFPLFGYDLRDYDDLFAEKLELLLRLRESERVTWEGGRHTPPIEGRGVYPRPRQDPLPIWVAVGGTPRSVARAGTLGLPLAIAIIGGAPARFRTLVDLHREAARAAGHDPAGIPIGINIHGFVADTTERAAEAFYPPFAHTMTQIGSERGWGPMTPQQYDVMRGPHGALALGDPEEVARKILFWHEIFDNERLLIQMSVGTMPHDQLLRSIELFGTEVAPIVRAEVTRRAAAAEPPVASSGRA
jgi:probable LLM family oxidoreductase